MTVLTIETGESNPILRTPCTKVDALTPELRTLMADMRHTMEAAFGIGLAANQVGHLVRIIIARSEGGAIYTLINPEIVNYSRDKVLLQESCLSIPNAYYPLYRPRSIRLWYRDEKFLNCSLNVSGQLARVIQHEVEHLDGKLFTDRVQRPTAEVLSAS